MAFCENRLRIKSKAFQEILTEESYLRDLKNRFPIQSPAWNSVWDQLDRILARKAAYERAVERRMMERGEEIPRLF